MEFNVFAANETEFENRRRSLEKAGFKILTTKLLDIPPVSIERDQGLKEGLALFNEERFWEAHETLEQVWRETEGPERDAIQSLILTCAAFVHYQKGETDICLSVLRRARVKMSDVKLPFLDLGGLRSDIDSILDSGRVQLFKLRSEAQPFRKSTTSAATKTVRARPPASSTPGSE